MMKRLLLIAVCCVACARAQDAARFAEVVNAYAEDDRFMGSVLVARDGQVIHQQSVGWANAEWKIPNSSATRYRLGSLTKQITAAAVLVLVEQGKLRLDDPLGKVLPAAPKAWAAVTLRQLLSHTGGVPNFTTDPRHEEWKRLPEGPAQIVARIADQPLEFTPGESFRYSNTGYLLLGWIIEETAGQPYAAFLRDHIFAPLGMNDSGCDSNTALIERRAAGYTPAGNGYVNAPYVDMHVPGGAGALYSTTTDLLRWTEGLFSGKLLAPESLAAMTTPVKSGYGFGLGIGERNGRRTIAHSGGIDGFSSHLAYYPESKLTIVLLANLNTPILEDLAGALASVAFGEAPQLPRRHTAIALPRSTLENYVGVYQLAPNFSLTLALDGDQLTAQGTNQPAFPLLAEAENRFYVRAVDAEIEFARDATGAVDHLVLHQGGRQTEAKRLPPANVATPAPGNPRNP